MSSFRLEKILDYSLIQRLWETRRENAQRLFSKIDEENLQNEKHKNAKVLDYAQNYVKEAINYAEKHSGILNQTDAKHIQKIMGENKI